MWILFICIHGILTGFFIIFRKQAVQKSNVFFVLALSSAIGFLLISYKYAEALALSWEYILILLGKSIIVSTSWALELYAIRDYYLSVLQPISAIKVVIAFLASMLIFGESATWIQFIGVFIVGAGILLLKNEPNKDIFLQRKNENSSKDKRILIFFLISCVLSEVSGIIDKFALQTITSNQMQWWFMLFNALIFILICFIISIKNKKFICTKSDWKNIYIYTVAFVLILADQFLFTGLMSPESKASIVSILKQLRVIVSVLIGGLIFKEKGLKKRLYYLVIIFLGIIIILL